MIRLLKNKSQYYTEFFKALDGVQYPRFFSYSLKNYSILLKKFYLYNPRNYEHLTHPYRFFLRDPCRPGLTEPRPVGGGN